MFGIHLSKPMTTAQRTVIITRDTEAIFGERICRNRSQEFGSSSSRTSSPARFAGTLLADMGADVVKVEPPAGDMGRATPPIRNGESVSFVALNRNKRSLVLDLKQPQAHEILLKLAAKSDVFLEAYRPGALDKLGLGAADVKAVNPRIVYTSVSGFGQTGPDRRRAGVNLIIEAFSGALSVTGEPGKMPMRPGVQTADVFGALFATYATLAALVGAARNGEGRIADVSLVEASIAAAAWEAAEYLETGQGAAAARQPAPAQRALSAVRDQRRALSRHRHAERRAVRQADAGARAGCASERSALFSSYASRKDQRGCAAAAGRAGRSRARGAGAGSRARWTPACPARGSTISRRCSTIRRSSRAAWCRRSSIRGSDQMRTTRNPVLLDHDGPDIERHCADAGRAFRGDAARARLFAGRRSGSSWPRG